MKPFCLVAQLPSTSTGLGVDDHWAPSDPRREGRFPTAAGNRAYSEGRTGAGRLWHGSRTEKKLIEDHGHRSFVFPNHENKQVRYSF